LPSREFRARDTGPEMTTDAEANDNRKKMFGHPAGLFVLFSAELWERFSFYGMRALLILYMTKELMFGDKMSYGIYGAYGSLVYATPIIGGLLADRILGFKRAIILGGVLMTLGHFAMAFDQSTLEVIFGAAATPVGKNSLELAIFGGKHVIDTTMFFYGALALLIIGNGFFKPNISSLVGRLYDDADETDAKRDGGFTIFYMGINIGALLAPLACGTLGEVYGWHWGFGLAGVGMLIGLTIFIAFQDVLYGNGEPPSMEKLEKSLLPGLSAGNAIYIGAFAAVPGIAWLVTAQDAMAWLLGLLGVVVLGGLLWYAAFRCTKEQRERIFVILILIVFSTVFWACFEQAGSSINLFTDRNVDRVVFGWEIPASVFQSVNPMFIIMLAPVFAWGWQKLRDLEWEPSTPVKFALGLLQLGAGFGVLVLGAQLAGDDGMVMLVFLMGGYLLHTTGELALSPVGLSMVTKLAPQTVVGVVMGAWFLSSSFAHYIAALIAKLASPPEGVEMKDLPAAETLPIYSDVFGGVAIFAVVAGLLCLALSPVLKKWMHGVN
jgi:POT family proton-dependent oligopeptide transporter